MVFSLEAMLALLSAVVLLSIASSISRINAPELTQVYEYQLLNDLLDVHAKATLSGEYVASSGFCLQLEETGNSAVFIPSNCRNSVKASVVSTTRITYRNGQPGLVKAELWKP